VIQIRSIAEPEADDFLSLLCQSFHLDKSRARDVFYSEPYFDISRKWAAFDEGKIVSILTTTPLDFGWGKAIGIAGVATAIDRRGEGLGQKLLEHVLDASNRAGEGPALLFAHETELYRRVGFEHIDDVVRGQVAVEPVDWPAPLEFDQVRVAYDAWAKADSERLIRDDQRWRFWNWVLRTCEPVGEGYICIEPNVVREVVGIGHRECWPGTGRLDWVGLRSMSEHLQVPVSNPKPELMLMARGFRNPPQMFMTDQF